MCGFTIFKQCKNYTSLDCYLDSQILNSSFDTNGFHIFLRWFMDDSQGKEILLHLFITPTGYRLEFALDDTGNLETLDLETALFLAREIIETTLDEGSL